jgi:hypothetical protein
MNLLPSMRAQKLAQHQAELDKALIHHEAKIGGKLFGPIPKGTRREFFCLDESTWVWHEEWTDQKGQRRIMTTRYDVRPDCVLKSQGGQSYRKLQGEEAKNFFNATDMYLREVTTEYRGMLQAA